MIFDTQNPHTMDVGEINPPGPYTGGMLYRWHTYFRYVYGYMLQIFLNKEINPIR